MALAPRKQELIADLATARTELVGHGQALTRDLDVGAKVKHAVRTHPAGWFGGATLLGLLLSKLPARSKVAIKAPAFRRDPTREAGKAAFLLTLLKFAFDLVRPVLTIWVKSRVFPSKKGM